MSFDAKVHTEDGVVTITLTGELDSQSAPGFHDVIGAATEQPVRQLVLLMGDLTYMSSAGLRCLVFAHQRLGRGVPFVLVGTTPDVAETIRLTGFDQSVIMEDSLGTR